MKVLTHCPEPLKVRYRNAREASDALIAIRRTVEQSRTKPEKVPQGFYECPGGGHWHLTSLEQNTLQESLRPYVPPPKHTAPPVIPVADTEAKIARLARRLCDVVAAGGYLEIHHAGGVVERVRSFK